MLKNPIQAFMEWFDLLAVVHREYIAHTYFTLTSATALDFTLSGQEAVFRFQHYIVKKDFALRLVSRMVKVRAVLDFIFTNKDLITVPAALGPSLADISEKQWETALHKWGELRNRELSHAYIRLWLKSELQRDNN